MKVSRAYLKTIITEEHKRLISEIKCVYADPIYINRVLGINLPLNESERYYLNEAKKTQILREHLLLEGLLGSIRDFVKSKTGPVKNFFGALHNILSDRSGRLMESFISLTNSKIIYPKLYNKQKTGLLNYIDKIINFINTYAAAALPTFKTFFEGFKNKILSIYNALTAMPKNSWKTVLASAGVAVIISWIGEKIIEKLKKLIPETDLENKKDDVIKAIKEQIYSFVNEYSQKILGTDLVNRLVSAAATNINPWLSIILKVVGVIDYVGKILYASTSRIANPII